MAKVGAKPGVKRGAKVSGRPAKNAILWDEIEELPMFQADSPVVDQAWNWLEKLRTERQSGTDLIAMKRLLELAHEYGARIND